MAMYKVLGRTSGNLVEIEVSGRLSREEIVRMGHEIRSLVEEHGKARLVLQLEQATAIGDDPSGPAPVVLELPVDVERVAVVVSAEEEPAAHELFPSEDQAAIRFFDPASAQLAWRWVSSPSEGGRSVPQ
jgi:hypothetical protein